MGYTDETAGAGTAASARGADPAWRSFYRIGGVLAFAYLALGIIAPGLMFLLEKYDAGMNGAATLAFIAAHKAWWIILQTLTLGPSILMVVVIAAIYLSVKHVARGPALLGAIVAGVCQILFAAYYPVLIGLVNLSDSYALADAAADAAGKLALTGAAEALLAVNNAFNPLYESVFAASVLALSLAMRRGPYHKIVPILGAATFVAAATAMLLWPLIGIGYFWWWIVFLAWFAAVGWKLLRLGRKVPVAG